MALTVSSTTDTQEQVNAAAGIAPPEPEVQEAEQPKESSQRPPKVPPEPRVPDEDEEEGEEQPDEEEKPQPVKKAGGFQRKIAKLEQEKDYVYRRLMAVEEQLRNGNGHKPQQQPQRTQGEPKASDFSDYDEYTNAMIDYRVGQKLESHKQELKRQEQERQQQEQVQGWRNRVGEFKTSAEDFDDVLASVDHIELTPALQQAIIEDDMGPKLAYELARHSDVFERIARLSPLAAIKALGEFKASLNRAAAPAPPQRKPVSQAPEPIRPVANGAGATVTKPLDQMSFQDYKRARNKQIAAARSNR